MNQGGFSPLEVGKTRRGRGFGVVRKGQAKESRRILEGPWAQAVEGSGQWGPIRAHPSTILISSSLSPTAYGSPLFRLHGFTRIGQTSLSIIDLAETRIY